MIRRVLILLLSLAPLLPNLPSQAQPGATALSRPGLRLLRSDECGVVLELTTPGYALTPAGASHRLTAPGVDLTAEPGYPQMPVVGALLGVPPDAQVELHLVADDATPLPARFELLPAPRPAPLADDLQPGRLLYEPDPAAYASDALYPAQPARIADDAWLRDQRIVRVELYPFQYNAARGALVWRQRLRVEVRFVGTRDSPGSEEPGSEYKAPSGLGLRSGAVSDSPEGFVTEPGDFSSGRAGIDDSPFEPVLRHTLLNYETARAWRVRSTQGAGQEPGFSAAAPRYKIVVDHDGLYRLTYADLQAAGMDVDDVDPRIFHLTSQGQDVAIYVAGEDDSHFDSGDFIAFYGQKYRGAIQAERYADEMAHWLTLCQGCQLAGLLEKYTDENVYWLTVGGEPGPRMATTDGTPTDTAPVPASYRTTVHAEEFHDWYTHHFASEDTWFWDRVQPGPADATRTYTMTLTALATGSFTATVRAAIVSRNSNSGHHTQFHLNGGSAPLDDAIWDGKGRYTFEAQAPHSQLLEGVNQLDFVILYNGAIEDMYFDWFEIDFYRQFQAEGDQLLFQGNEGGVLSTSSLGRSTRGLSKGGWQYEIGNFLSEGVEVYDVTDPLAPQRVLNPRITEADGTYTVAFQDTHDAGAQYLAVGDTAVQSPRRVTLRVPPDPSLHSGQALRSPANGADYIIIVHRDFYTATQTLAAHRQAQGLRTVVVDVDDLYDEFNDGIFNPIAIKNFLAYAYANWQPPAPAYALLVGDGHWNFKGYGVERYGPPEPIYIPPNLAWVDPWQGEVDSTNLLATIVGDDILPDLHIGRLPVNSVEELNAVTNKIVAYESAGLQDWHRHILFVADNVPDDAGDFVAVSDDIIANYLPERYQADRIYVNDYCGPPTSPPTPCPAVNAAIVETLNETGALLVSYAGHGSVERWAAEQIFTNDDITSLSNGARLPVFLSMTCLDGYFIYPNRPCLAEELLRAEGRGGVSTWSPTGLGVTTGQHVLRRGFYSAVFQDDVSQLGPATLAAKLELYATGGNYDLIHTFTIFGDPALHLQPPPWKTYLPIIQKT